MPNLVLSRKIGETIVIDEKITITVVGNDSGQTRLSIDAPRAVSIRRGELAPRPNGQASGARVDHPHAGNPQGPPVTFRKRRATPPSDVD
jgi:carbon storage regulator